MKFLLNPKNPKGTVVTFRDDIPAHRFSIDTKQSELQIKSEKEYSLRQYLILIRKVVQVAKAHECRHLIFEWEKLTKLSPKKIDKAQLATLIGENLIMANYQFSFYKKREKGKYVSVETLSFLVPESEKILLQKNLRIGLEKGTYINWCRNMANTPGNDMTPKIFSEEVRRAVRKENDSKLQIKVLSEKEIRKLKMGGVVAVGQGSREESKFIVLEYWGGKKGEAPTALVGKGVTFDSGGIDTKPSPYALEMMMDMSGGAAVITTTLIAAKLGIKKNIVALVPAVENMPSGESFRPGDVIFMHDGTSVEIGHTDAEGRLILGDAISYAKKYKPSKIINVATLTGAAEVALGERATALFSEDDRLAKALYKAGELTGDAAWRLPLWPEYKAEIIGNVADISNVRTKGRDGVGGAITAAHFVAHFAGKTPFAHLDMAPSMTAVFDEELCKGAKGAPVRLLVQFLQNE